MYRTTDSNIETSRSGDWRVVVSSHEGDKYRGEVQRMPPSMKVPVPRTTVFDATFSGAVTTTAATSVAATKTKTKTTTTTTTINTTATTTTTATTATTATGTTLTTGTSLFNTAVATTTAADNHTHQQTGAFLQSSNPVISPAKRSLTSGHKPQPLSEAMAKLFEAVDEQDLPFFKNLSSDIAKQKAGGIDLDAIDPATLRSPLTWALECDQPDIVVELLMKGASPVTQDGRGRRPEDLASPLLKIFIEFFELYYLAADKETSLLHTEFMGRLNEVDSTSGHTMLSWAIERKQDELAGLLMWKRADLMMKNKRGHTALESAARSGSLDILDKILGKWPRLSKPENLSILRSALMGAVEHGRPQVIAALLSFFRKRYRTDVLRRLSEKSLDSHLRQEDKKRSPTIASEAYAHGVSPNKSGALTTERAMSRTSDACLLTDDEYTLLDMDNVWKRANQRRNQPVLQMLAAHCKQPVGASVASNDDV